MSGPYHDEPASGSGPSSSRPDLNQEYYDSGIPVSRFGLLSHPQVSLGTLARDLFHPLSYTLSLLTLVLVTLPSHQIPLLHFLSLFTHLSQANQLLRSLLTVFQVLTTATHRILSFLQLRIPLSVEIIQQQKCIQIIGITPTWTAPTAARNSVTVSG